MKLQAILLASVLLFGVTLAGPSRAPDKREGPGGHQGGPGGHGGPGGPGGPGRQGGPGGPGGPVGPGGAVFMGPNEEMQKMMGSIGKCFQMGMPGMPGMPGMGGMGRMAPMEDEPMMDHSSMENYGWEVNEYGYVTVEDLQNSDAFSSCGEIEIVQQFLHPDIKTGAEVLCDGETMFAVGEVDFEPEIQEVYESEPDLVVEGVLGGWSKMDRDSKDKNTLVMGGLLKLRDSEEECKYLLFDCVKQVVNGIMLACPKHCKDVDEVVYHKIYMPIPTVTGYTEATDEDAEQLNMLSKDFAMEVLTNNDNAVALIADMGWDIDNLVINRVHATRVTDGDLQLINVKPADSDEFKCAPFKHLEVESGIELEPAMVGVFAECESFIGYMKLPKTMECLREAKEKAAEEAENDD